MLFTKMLGSTLNPDFVNFHNSPSCRNMNDEIIKSTNHQKETQNVTKKLQIITHPSTLQSVRKIPTCNANPSTTVMAVHNIIQITHWQLRNCFCVS
jgi:hypothetical protein